MSVGSVERNETWDEMAAEKLAEDETTTKDSVLWVTEASDVELTGKILEEGNASELSVTTEDCSATVLEPASVEAPDAVLDNTVDSTLAVLLIGASVVELGATKVDWVSDAIVESSVGPAVPEVISDAVSVTDELSWLETTDDSKPVLTTSDAMLDNDGEAVTEEIDSPETVDVSKSVLSVSDARLDDDGEAVGKTVEASEEVLRSEELEDTSTEDVAEAKDVSVPVETVSEEIAEVVGVAVGTLERSEEARLEEMLNERLEKRLLERLLDRLATMLLEISLEQLSGQGDGEGGVTLVSTGGDVVIGGVVEALVDLLDVTVAAG